MQHSGLLTTALLLFPISVSAQIIADNTKATVARDSLFSQVAITRQQIEQKAKSITTKAYRAGARRIVVQSYYAGRTYYPDNQSPTKRTTLAWKHKIVHRQNSSSRELFTAYLENGKKTIQERRHNGVVTWLWLQSYQEVHSLTQPTFKLSGTYANNRYLRWGGTNYMLPTRLPTP